MALKISIITATYNSQDTLKDCLDSVCRQTGNIEHLVIDGASEDHSVDIARSYSHVSHVVSEPDHGIYDAMNKGIDYTTGDVVGILNSDDFYADDQVLQKVAAVFKNPEIDSCYGDLHYVHPVDTEKVTRNWKSGRFHSGKFRWGWMPPHPTFFVRRSVYERFGRFNLELGSAADYELMLRFLVKRQISCQYIPDVLVKMRGGGASNASLKNRLRANRMDRKAWDVNQLNPYPWTIPMKPLRKVGQFIGV